MVNAILAGRKTMTRRIMKPQPCGVDNNDQDFLNLSPYGKPGDLLFVRESHYQFGQWNPNSAKEKGFKFYPDKSFPWLRYMENPPYSVDSSRSKSLGWHKRPSIFLPKEHSRIWLEVTERKAERLHDISGRDAKEEGVLANSEICCAHSPYCYTCPFEALWKKINGVPSWNENPWTWATTFKVLSTTGKP